MEGGGKFTDRKSQQYTYLGVTIEGGRCLFCLHCEMKRNVERRRTAINYHNPSPFTPAPPILTFPYTHKHSIHRWKQDLCVKLTKWTICSLHTDTDKWVWDIRSLSDPRRWMKGLDVWGINILDNRDLWSVKWWQMTRQACDQWNLNHPLVGNLITFSTICRHSKILLIGMHVFVWVSDFHYSRYNKSLAFNYCFFLSHKTWIQAVERTIHGVNIHTTKKIKRDIKAIFKKHFSV